MGDAQLRETCRGKGIEKCLVHRLGRGLLVRNFLKHADRDAAARVMPAFVEWRSGDRHHSAQETRENAGARGEGRLGERVRWSAAEAAEAEVDRGVGDGPRIVAALQHERAGEVVGDAEDGVADDDGVAVGQ